MALEENKKHELLTAFYRERLLPLGEVAAARGIEYFPLSADASVESYYVDRDDDGNYVHTVDDEDLAGELKKLWADFPELAALAGPIVELAEQIKEDEESTQEISPFIYAMF